MVRSQALDPAHAFGLYSKCVEEPLEGGSCSFLKMNGFSLIYIRISSFWLLCDP